MLRRLATLILLFLFAPALVPGALAQSGAFRLTVTPPPEGSDEEIVYQAVLVDGRIAEDVELLNEMLELPEPIEVVLGENEQDASFYDPETRQIWLDYTEFATELYAIVEDDPEAAEDDIVESLVDSIEFGLFHEVGHALIDVLQLPVVGIEENVVDSLATIILLDLVDDPEAAASAAWTFVIASQEDEEITQERLGDAHALDGQRFANIVCLIVGSDPAAHAELAEDAELPEDRTALCEEDYARQSASWAALLGPYRR